MPIVVIRFGYKEEGQAIGWAARRCRFCQAVQPMGVYRIARKHAISDIGVGKFSAYCHRLVCAFCNESVDFDLNAPLKVSTSWRPDADPLQLLVDETRPELGQIPERHERSISEVVAVLLRSDEWARYAFHNEGNRGCLAGLLFTIALVVGCVAGYLMSPAAQPNAPPHARNYAVLFGLPFALFVTLGTYFLWRHWGIRRLIARRLTAASHIHGIRKSQYQKAVAGLKSCPKRIIDAIARSDVAAN